MSPVSIFSPNNGMLKNYFTVAFRGLRRQKLYAFINVFGLALGMACCIVMLSFVRHEWSYDSFHDDADRIYRVNIRSVTPGGDVNRQAGQPLPLARTVKEELPDVTAASSVRISDILASADGNDTFEAQALFSDSDFFEVFSFGILQGSSTLSSPDEVIITIDAARKYFGHEHAVGRTLLISVGGDFETFTVGGVVETPPSTSSLRFEFILPIQWWPSFNVAENDWSSWGTNTFLRVRERPPSAEQLEAVVARHFGPMIQTWEILQWLSTDEGAFRLELQPLTSIHFSPEVTVSHASAINPTYLYVLLALAMVVLLVACVNFATLSVGRSTRRAREVGLRKVLGAARTELMRQFWGEALWMSLLALVVGLILAQAFVPFLNEAVDRSVTIDIFGDATVLAGIAVLAIVTGLVAGLYPALYLSRFGPADVFRVGAGTRRTSGWIQALVVGQFACSIFIIAAVLIASSQLRFVKEKSLGFEDERVMVIPTHSGDAAASERLVEVLERELSSLPAALSVTAASSAFNHDLAWNSFNIGQTGHTVYLSRVRPGFTQAMQMRMAAGRGFAEEHPSDAERSIIVNEAFVRDFDLEDPVGRQLNDLTIGRIENPTIIGVVEDYHFQSLYEPIQPAALFTGSDYPFGYVYVRLRSGDLAAASRDLESVWQRLVPERPFTGYFLDEDFDRLYRTEVRWHELVRWASAFTLVIACMGLFGLATFSAERRTKEIGIRKVLGADVMALAALLSKDFVRLVLVAFVIAAPAAYVAMRRWLDEFAYRVDIQPEQLILAGVLAVGIALATVSYQAVRAATADPVTTLRSE